jgi:DNA-binding IclR family transcriptional regulator/ABC-type xylose transport system substrate-binding protein
MVREEERGQVRSAYRALDLIEVLSSHASGMTFSQVMEALQLPRSSTHDLLQTLVGRRYLEFQPEGRLYRLGSRMLGVSADSLNNTELIRKARPELARLAEQFGETAHIAVLDGAQALYVAAEETTESMRMISPVGKRVPLHATAVGKTLLAGLNLEEMLEAVTGPAPLFAHTSRTITSLRDLRVELGEVQRLGFAMDCEEYAAGVLCVAAPVTDQSGKVVAALGVSIPSGRLDLSVIRRITHAVKDAAERVFSHPGPKVSTPPVRPLRIGVSVAQRMSGFHREAERAGLEKVRTVETLQERYQLEVIWANARESELKQVTDIHEFLRTQVDAVIIQPVSNRAADAAFRELALAKIPAVCFQRPARSRAVRYYVGGDTFVEGVMQVEYVADRLEGTGTVVLIEGDPYHENARNMALGALDCLQKYPGLELVFNQSVQSWSGAEAAQMVTELLESCIRPDAIIVANDDMAGAVAEVLMRWGLSEKTILVGGDGDRDALHRIRAGTQHATVFQNPASLAEEAVLLAMHMALGQAEPQGMERRSVLRSPVGPSMLIREVPYLLVSKENLPIMSRFWQE